MGELNTPADAGTEPVETHEDDNAEPTTYWDPDEDQDTPEADTGEATDDGSEEAADTEEAEPETPAQINLPDGTQVTLDEAVKGYLRQADYTRKVQETAEMRKVLSADLQLISGVTETLIDHLVKMVPPAPDFAFRMRDPVAAARMQAQHDAAMGQVQKLVEIGKKPREIGEKLGATDRQSLMAQENALLVERFPAVATPQGRQKFFESAATAAQEVGFSMDELSGATDHRLFVLAHWANEGMKAAKAREAAKAKVANVPPTTPRKPGQSAQSGRNSEAVQRFRKSPTMRNAVAAGWAD